MHLWRTEHKTRNKVGSSLGNNPDQASETILGKGSTYIFSSAYGLKGRALPKSESDTGAEEKI